MQPRTPRYLWRGAALLGLAALAIGCARYPVAEGPRAAWSVVPVAGVAARLDALDAGDGGGQALRLRFATGGPERRFVAIEGKPQGDPATATALSAWYRLVLDGGSPPKLALLVLESDGGAWFRLGPAPLATDATAEARLPLSGFRKAAFAQDADPEPRWEQAERFQLGLVFEGPAEGTLELGTVAFTTGSARPTTPLPIPFANPSLWSIGKDAAAQCRLVPGKDGPNGQPSMRIEFAFPGGRHIFVTPSLRLQDFELDGYRGVRFAYKASLPKGIPGLLVMVTERADNSQYHLEQAPPASEEWTIADIAFARLKLGQWSKDENGQLDLADVVGLIIGVHGTAADPQASGWILVSQIELVP